MTDIPSLDLRDDFRHEGGEQMTGNTAMPADSCDMYAVHNMLRRGFGELPDLVRGVGAGEQERAGLVADHARLLVTILSTHHEAEDAILWPKLIERRPDEAGAVAESMEQQHQQLRARTDAVTECADRYQADGSAARRDDLARSVEDVLEPLHEHLTAEEREVLPLIDRYLTMAEWAAVGEHGLPHLTASQMHFVFGMMLRVATEDQRAVLAGNVPQEVFEQMARVAPAALEAYERELNGAAVPAGHG